jgi:hypothetical protein
MKTFQEFREQTDKINSFKSPQEIAKKHKVDSSLILDQLKAGIKIEKEHTKDEDLAKIIALQHLNEIPDYYTRLNKLEKQAKKSSVSEGTLHHWFKGSKSKDGKPGWVQADGSPCANEPGETKTPKCFSSGRLKSLKRLGKKGKSLINSAIRRKRKQDPEQQEKSGASKPKMVKTFAKGKRDPNYIKAEPGIKESVRLNEGQKDIPGKGSGTKDACYYKVKSRFSVWPSAYGSAALVKCRKVGAANWGKTSKKLKEEYTRLQINGNTFTILLSWRGIPKTLQMFFPNMKVPTKEEVTFEVNKVYPGAIVLSYKPSRIDPTKPYVISGDNKK